MTILQAIILGLVQGLTEFLPVSSSGHLVIMQAFLGINEPTLTFEIFLHFGTLVAIFVVFWRDIWSVIRDPFQHLSWIVVVGSIPTAIMGFAFKPYFTVLYSSLLAVGIALLITGIVLIAADRLAQGRKSITAVTWTDALLIGLVQGLAITPGISRSGITISMGLMRGLSRETAARFSFLLSIPAVLGANLLEVKDLVEAGGFQGDLLPLIIGTLVAALSGIFAIKFLVKILQGGRLHYFSYYVWLVGAFLIITSLI